MAFAFGASLLLFQIGASPSIAMLPGGLVVAALILSKPVQGAKAIALLSPLGLLVIERSVAGLNVLHILGFFVLLAALTANTAGQRRPAMLLAISLYICSVIVSFANALVSDPEAIHGLPVAVGALGHPLLAIAVALTCRSFANARSVLTWFLVGGAIAGALNLALYFGFAPIVDLLGVNPFDVRKARFTGLGFNPNGLATQYVLLLPLAYGAAVAERGAHRFLAIVAAVLAILVIMASASRSAVLGAFVGLSLFAMISTARVGLARRGLHLLALGSIVVGTVLVMARSGGSEEVERRLDDGFTSTTLAGRDEMASVTIRLILETPLGIGFGQFKKRIHEYGSTRLTTPHNSILTIGSENGWLGLASVFAIIALVVRGGRRAARQQRDPQRLYSIALMCGLAGFLAHAMFHSVHHLGALWVYLGVAAFMWNHVPNAQSDLTAT